MEPSRGLSAFIIATLAAMAAAAIFPLAFAQPCNTAADTDCDGNISLGEITAHIEQWYACSSCVPNLIVTIHAYYGICFNDTGCVQAGSFCDVSANAPYTCSPAGNGCLNRTNGAQCGSGYHCSSGACEQLAGSMIFVDNRLASDCDGTYSVAGRNCNGSDGRAYNTIYEGMQNAIAGDLVFIRNGTYTGSGYYSSVVRNSGTAQNPITFRNYPGERFVIQGTYDHLSVHSSSPVYLADRANLVFDGFEIANHHIGFYLAANVKNITIRNLIVHDCIYGIAIRSNSSNILIENAEGYKNAAYHDGGCGVSSLDSSGIVVKNFYSHDNDDLDGPYGDADGFCTSGGEDMAFINCTSAHNSEDGFDLTGLNVSLIGSEAYGNGVTGIKTWRRGTPLLPSNFTVAYSLSYGNGESGISASNGPNLSVYNSVFYGNGAEGIRIIDAPAGETPRGIFYNNIIMNNGFFTPVDNTSGYPSFIVGSNWNVIADNNLYYNNWDNVTYAGEGNHSLLDANPMFAGAPIGDFNLQAGSPAIGNGTLIPGYHCPASGLHPGEGCSVWYGDAPDIGAYEHFEEEATCSDGIRNQDEADTDCGGSCTACVNGKSCLSAGDCSSGYCNSSNRCAPMPTCLGTDTSCGTYPSCANCNAQDACSGTGYRNYSCQGGACTYSEDSCTDCSCSCGGYGTAEAIANGNCADGLDNDCDGSADGNDSQCVVATTEAIIADHNAADDFDIIPDYWLAKAKELTLHYAHRSDGNQIFEGLDLLNQMDPVKYKYARIGTNSSGDFAKLPPVTSPPSLRAMDGNPPLNPYVTPALYWDSASGRSATAGNAATGLFNISMWSWCNELSETHWSIARVKAYLDQMSAFEQQFPGVVFIYHTGYTDNTDNVSVNDNWYIRNYTIANNKVLYDFDDIGQYDPDGNYYPNADRVCTWCIGWCANHTADCASLPSRCSHSESVAANKFVCVRRAMAFWWLMARLAGWDGT